MSDVTTTRRMDDCGCVDLLSLRVLSSSSLSSLCTPIVVLLPPPAEAPQIRRPANDQWQVSSSSGGQCCDLRTAGAQDMAYSISSSTMDALLIYRQHVPSSSGGQSCVASITIVFARSASVY